MPRPILATLALLLGVSALAAEPGPQAAPTPIAAPAPVAAPAPTTASGVLLDRVVAIVNDGIVTQSELNERMSMEATRMRQQSVQLPPVDTLRRLVLDQLVMDEIQWQRAERIGIEITDEDVNQDMRQLAQSNNLALDQLPEAMAREGINYTAFRENRRREMARQQLRRREVFNRVNITPRELEQFMERMKKSPDERAEYNFSHILIALPSDANQEKVGELQKLADDVYRRAATEDFAQLAIAHSNSQTALEGGQMGWRRGAELPTLLAETIASLKPGEVAKPISAVNGFHIVKLNDRRSADGSPVQEQVHARHILMTTNALQDDATVRLRLAGIRERVLAGEEFAAFAASLSEDPGSAVNGGDLEWIGPGDFVPEFEAEMAKLKDGEISEPFQTQFGWHITQVLGRRSFDTTEEAIRRRALEQLRVSKADQDMESWVRRLRDESFVDSELN